MTTYLYVEAARQKGNKNPVLVAQVHKLTTYVNGLVPVKGRLLSSWENLLFKYCKRAFAWLRGELHD